MSESALRSTPVTIAELDNGCQRYALLPGHIDVGAVVPCPDGDHEHRVLTALHTAVAENVNVIAVPG